MSKFLSFDLSDIPTSDEDNSDQTEDFEYGQTAYVNTASGSLNLRMQPTLNAGVLTTIPPYARVTITAYGNEWCAVRYGTYDGYAMTRYLRFDESSDQGSSESEKMPETEIQIPAWVVTASGSLNLRRSSNGNADILCTVPRHAQVMILEKGEEWCRISYGDVVGYAMSRFLSTEKPDEIQTGKEENKPATHEQNHPEDEQHDPYVSIGDLILDVTLEAPADALYAETAKETLVYPMCSDESTVLKRIPAGETVEIVLIGDLWCRIDYQNEQGYCPRDQLNVREVQ